MRENQIAQIFHYHRKKSGLSQAALARLAGVGKTVVFDIEKGKRTIRLDTLLKVMYVLNIQLDFKSKLMDLFDKEQNDEKS